jgi:hypothetical protein
MNAWPQTSRDRRWKHCAGWELLLVLVALITLAGCQGISVASKQPTTPSGAVSFGSVGVGASKTLTATATNHATAAVTVASAVSTATQFSLTRHSLTQPTSPSNVAGSQNATLSISFTPSATGSSTGSFAGSFAITSAASDSPVTVSLFVTGTGFSVNGLNHPVTLAAGESVTFSVIFAPQSAGNASGNLVIASNASNRTLNIPLSGTGTTTGQLAVSPARLSLGNVEVGTSASVPATLSATGASVTVYSVELSNSEFTLSGITFPTTITAGNSVQFAVKFTPQAAASASGTASFSSNVSHSPAVLSWSGTGIPAPVASVTVTPSSTTIVIGKTQQFSATAKDARGNVITGVGFTWNSDAPSVATVDANGLATAANQGTARITARASGATGSVILKADAASSSNAELFGLHVQSLATPWPSIGFGGFRLYSNLSGGMTRWALLNKAKGTYDFSVLDSWLAKLYSHGVTNVVYTFSQVPKWASSHPTDTACDFATSSPFYGGCDLPTDINPDGSGTDATYINFVTALAQHVNNPTYLQTHAQIKYWEPWNEWLRNDLVNTSPWAHISVRATYAQMVRMAEDARCIITGTGSVNGVPCTAMPIDTTAKIVSPSDGGQDCCGSAGVFQNFLYCNGAGKNAPIPGSECTTGSRGSAAVDIINTHFYEAAGLPPENLGKNVQQYKALLSATDLAKPLWSTEGSWGKDSAVTDPDVQASWVARYYLMGWSSGLEEMYWYAYDSPTYGQLWTSSGGLNLAGVAYGQVYIWIVNSTLTTPCSATGTVWTCGFTLANGKAVDAIWDTSQTCSDGNCATSKQSVSTAWTNYQDLTGTTNAITNGTVPVGIKPILLTSSAP